MFLRIENISKIILAGMMEEMSFSDNRTIALWQHFMPMRGGIPTTIDEKLYSVEVYPPHFFSAFDLKKKFEKWAAVEVASAKNLPEDLETFIIPAGKYAIFLHKGAASEGPRTYRHIFEEWLPESGFKLDDRPHFAVMDERYKNDSPDSEEEVWIPVSR